MKTFIQTLAFIGLCTMLSFSTLDVIVLNNDGAKFLADATDARMMAIEEGRLAAEKGTSPDIKMYGKLMMKDHSMLLKELKNLAASKKMALPSAISEEKEKALINLKEKTGKDFDRKFLSMIKTDHLRDVKEFKEAATSKDKDIKAFATKHLPLLESHLTGVEGIKESK